MKIKVGEDEENWRFVTFLTITNTYLQLKFLTAEKYIDLTPFTHFRKTFDL